MDLKIIKETLDVRETIFEGNPEQGFECDILLPDYCPDIRRILKCHISPKISQCYQNSDKVNVDGFIYVKVYYLCDQDKIHSYDSKIPFSKVLDLKETADNVSVSVGATTNYVNCRAVNQRRLDVRGAITLKTRVTGSKKEEIVSDAAGDGVRLRKKTINTSALCCESSTQFSVQEEEGVTGAPVNAIIRSDAVITLTDVKIIPNKAILKGEMKVTTVYTDAETENPITAVHVFPISRIMDIDRLTTDCQLVIKTDVVSLDVSPKQDEEGTFSKLNFDVKVNIFAKCYEPKTITLATDAYSTQFGCNYTAGKIAMEHVNSVIDETFTYRTQTEISNTAIDRIIDLWCFAKSPVTALGGSKISVEIPVDVFTFYQGEDGSADFAESTIMVPYEFAVGDEVQEATFDPDVKILSCDYSFIAPNKVELKFDMNVSGAVVLNRADRCISEINMDYSSPKKADEIPALTIYYCDKGEEVWDIAKRYNTCPDSIKTENELDCEVINDHRVILIPLAN